MLKVCLQPFVDPLKILVSLLLVAPLGLAMGMPFPLGLRLLSRRETALVPWAWGINGCASVVSPILATVLAVWLGFTVVILSALFLYLIAAVVLLRSGAEAKRG